jgi:uncharacterized damage-inducible protein DinB
MKEQLLSTLEISKNYTLEVADAMPEQGYSLKPVDSIWNFGELLSHIAYGIQWWEANYVKGEKMDWAPPVAKTGKNDVRKYLESAYDGLKNTISSGNSNESVVRGFYAALDHITHHRGQATIYLRANGIVPPEYAY